MRLVTGVLLIHFVIDWLTIIDSGDYQQPFILLWVLFSIALAPYVVNIGFGINLGAIPRYALIAVWGAGLLLGLTIERQFLSETLWTVIETTQIYIYGHLGVSFLLAGILATPGCEMRAIPHLLGKLSRSGSRDHYCPGFIDTVDRWEQGGRPAGGIGAESSRRDILDSPRGKLLVYGLPFVALQLAGNLGGFVVATAVPALAFVVTGLACLVIARRCHRMHCYFMAPWCLAAGTLTGLYSLRVIDLGPHSWDILVNGGMLGGLLIYLTTERIWGRYLD